MTNINFLVNVQGVKVYDDLVDSLTSGAWQALGNAWKDEASLVQKYVWIAGSSSDIVALLQIVSWGKLEGILYDSLKLVV